MSKVLFPSWRYHPTLPARIVDSPEAAAELSPEWVDAPVSVPENSDVPGPAPEPEPTLETEPEPEDDLEDESEQKTKRHKRGK